MQNDVLNTLYFTGTRCITTATIRWSNRSRCFDWRLVTETWDTTNFWFRAFLYFWRTRRTTEVDDLDTVTQVVIVFIAVRGCDQMHRHFPTRSSAFIVLKLRINVHTIVSRVE